MQSVCLKICLWSSAFERGWGRARYSKPTESIAHLILFNIYTRIRTASWHVRLFSQTHANLTEAVKWLTVVWESRAADRFFCIRSRSFNQYQHFFLSKTARQILGLRALPSNGFSPSSCWSSPLVSLIPRTSTMFNFFPGSFMTTLFLGIGSHTPLGFRFASTVSSHR